MAKSDYSGYFEQVNSASPSSSPSPAPSPSVSPGGSHGLDNLGNLFESVEKAGTKLRTNLKTAGNRKSGSKFSGRKTSATPSITTATYPSPSIFPSYRPITYVPTSHHYYYVESRPTILPVFSPTPKPVVINVQQQRPKDNPFDKNQKCSAKDSDPEFPPKTIKQDSNDNLKYILGALAAVAAAYLIYKMYKAYYSSDAANKHVDANKAVNTDVDNSIGIVRKCCQLGSDNLIDLRNINFGVNKTDGQLHVLHSYLKRKKQQGRKLQHSSIVEERDSRMFELFRMWEEALFESNQARLAILDKFIPDELIRIGRLAEFSFEDKQDRLDLQFISGAINTNQYRAGKEALAASTQSNEFTPSKQNIHCANKEEKQEPKRFGLW